MRLSVCLSVCLPVCLSIYLSVCLSACLSVYPSSWQPASLSVCLAVYLCVTLSVCLFVCLSVCLSVCLTVCVYVSQPVPADRQFISRSAEVCHLVSEKKNFNLTFGSSIPVIGRPTFSSTRNAVRLAQYELIMIRARREYTYDTSLELVLRGALSAPMSLPHATPPT